MAKMSRDTEHKTDDDTGAGKYDPVGRLRARRFREDLRQDAERDARKIADHLKQTYGATVYCIGSVAEKDRPFSSRSDIDLVVKGLPRNRYFAILAEISDMSEFGVDLIPYEDANELAIEMVKTVGIEL
ncbi:MAG: DNA polymerase subunit beta [Spirochaetaceae bacterium]|nr:MAG: DNA polymerase subunit beta [Spirochaetaceae bacterium]